MEMKKGAGGEKRGLRNMKIKVEEVLKERNKKDKVK